MQMQHEESASAVRRGAGAGGPVHLVQIPPRRPQDMNLVRNVSAAAAAMAMAAGHIFGGSKEGRS